MKLPTRPEVAYVRPDTVAMVLEAFRPFGAHRHTMAEHARYFLVDLSTVKRWHKRGFPLGQYGRPDWTTWLYCLEQAEAWHAQKRGHLHVVLQLHVAHRPLH